MSHEIRSGSLELAYPLYEVHETWAGFWRI